MGPASAAVQAVSAGEGTAAAPARQDEATQPPVAPAWTLGGELFADYYVVAAHEPRSRGDDLEGRQGFWLRRVYLTYDHRLTPRLSTRLRLEANSAGDFVSDDRVEPFVKDASVRLALGAHELAVGLVPTATLQLADRVWGLRSVEKTPLDLFRFDSSRDLGALLTGPIGRAGRWRYEFQLGNGAGVSSETNDAKTVRGAVSWQHPAGFLVQAYADHQARTDEGDWTTGKLMAAFWRPGWRAGSVYARQRRRAPTGEVSPVSRDLDLLSAFGVVRVHERVQVFGRVDRVLDPLPGAASIDYLPVSGLAPPTLWLAGADIVVEGPLRVQPHVEVVDYRRGPTGVRPSATVSLRVTLAVRW